MRFSTIKPSSGNPVDTASNATRDDAHSRVSSRRYGAVRIAVTACQAPSCFSSPTEVQPIAEMRRSGGLCASNACGA